MQEYLQGTPTVFFFPSKSFHYWYVMPNPHLYGTSILTLDLSELESACQLNHFIMRKNTKKQYDILWGLFQ